MLHVLAHWGARSLGPPASESDLEPGWLPGALRIALPSDRVLHASSSGSATSVASLADDEIVEGAIEDPDAVIVGDAPGFYRLMVERELDGVSIEGDVEVVRAMLAALPAPVERASATA